MISGNRVHQQLTQRNLERELAEGYAANAELFRRIADEFTRLDLNSPDAQKMRWTG